MLHRMIRASGIDSHGVLVPIQLCRIHSPIVHVACTEAVLKREGQPVYVKDVLLLPLLQNKARHFKDLAVRAVNSKQYERAIELLNVALHFDPGSASTSEFQHQVHSLLAAAYFGGRRYAEAADCGHKCFKIKPTKSQVRGTPRQYASLACSHLYFEVAVVAQIDEFKSAVFIVRLYVD